MSEILQNEPLISTELKEILEIAVKHNAILGLLFVIGGVFISTAGADIVLFEDKVTSGDLAAGVQKSLTTPNPVLPGFDIGAQVGQWLATVLMAPKGATAPVQGSGATIIDFKVKLSDILKIGGIALIFAQPIGDILGGITKAVPAAAVP